MAITIRLFSPEQWQDFRTIRLMQLKHDGHLFYRTYDWSAAQPETYWRDMLTKQDEAVWGVYDENELIGMTGIYVRDEDRTTATLWGSWLRPNYRGGGLSDVLYRTRIDWATAHPTVTRIITSHKGTNTPSQRANQRHGFVYTHTAERVWGDGSTEDEPFYELLLPPKA